MISSLLSFALLGQPAIQQDEARDWEFRGARWETMAPLLAQELGQPVRVLESIRDEVVVGRFVGKTRVEMMSAFGAATLTRWSEQDGTIVIAPDGRARQSEEKEKLRRRTEIIQKNIDYALGGRYDQESLDKAVRDALGLSKSLGSGAEYDYETMQKLERMTPGTRIANEFLKTFGAAEIAKVTEQSRTVFTSNPTKYQRSLGGLGSAMVAEANRLRALHQDSLRRLAPGDGHQQGYYFGLLHPGYTEEPIADVKVVLSTGEQTGSVDVEFLSKEGHAIIRGNAWVNGAYDMAKMEALQTSSRQSNGQVVIPETPFSKYKSKVPNDPRSVKWGKIRMRAEGTTRSEAETQEVLKMLSLIERDEPLGWTATYAFFTLSKESGKDVAGRLDDQMIYLGATRVADGKEPPELAVGVLLGQFTYYEDRAIEESNSGFVLKPIFSSNYRLDRKVLALLANEKLAKGTVNFDTLAKAALASDNRRGFQSSLDWIESLNRSNGNGYISEYYSSEMSQDDYSALRIYGSLSPGMRDQVKRGSVKLLVGDLPPKAREELVKCLLFQQNSIRVKGMHWPGDDRPSEAEQQRSSALMEKYGGQINEPTFVLALPEAAPVMVEISIGKRTDILGQSGTNQMIRGSVDQLAQRAALAHYALEQGVSSEGYAPISAFSTQENDLLTIAVTLGDAWEGGVECEVTNAKMGAMVSLDKLPEDIKAAYDKALARYIESYKGVTFGDGGASRAVPPPGP